jgi:magnesium-protoporphyrin IX monomethyl ester (oxidative) cyclase
MSHDIVLVALPLIWGQEYRLDLKPPVNLIYLASYLRNTGINAAVIDAVSRHYTLHNLVNRVTSYNTRYVGLPFYHASMETSKRFIEELRRAAPYIRIVGGGPSATIEPGLILSEMDVDVLVLGEGEMTLKEVVERKEAGYDGIPGTALLKEENLIRSETRQSIDDLDSLPFLDYSLIDMEVYFHYQERLGVPPSVFLTTSRGCAFRCVFCATPLLWPGKVRRYSPGRIIEEIKFQRSRYPFAHIGFLDDSFFSDRAWLHSFFSSISSIDTHYHCIGRLDQLDEDSIRHLDRTGCNFIAFGVETGSHKRQEVTKKYLNLEKVKENLSRLSRYDIVTKGFFMLGFPDETIKDMADTINMAIEMKRLGMKQFSVFPLIVYPGTELSERFAITRFDSSIYEHYDAAVEDMDDFGEQHVAMYSTVPQTDVNPYLTHTEIVELVKYAYKKIDAMECITVKEIENLVHT